jgi:hypothetical protein
MYYLVVPQKVEICYFSFFLDKKVEQKIKALSKLAKNLKQS